MTLNTAMNSLIRVMNIVMSQLGPFSTGLIPISALE